MARQRISARRLVKLSLAAAVGVLGLSGVRATGDVLQWDPAMNGSGSGGTGTWDLNNTANWFDTTSSTEVSWTDQTGVDTAVFGGTGGTVSLNNSLSAAGLQFTVDGYTLQSGSGTQTLSLGAAGIDASSLTTGNAATLAANLNLTLLASQTWKVGTGASLTVGGVVGGTGGLTIAGPGTVMLTGANTFSGDVKVTGGTLNLQNSSALGTATTAVSLTSLSSKIQLQGGITISGRQLLAQPPSSGDMFALDNVSGNNTWAGDIVVTNTNITRFLSEAGVLTLSGNITNGGSGSQFVLQGNGNGVISGVISGAGQLTKSTTGTGTWTIAGASNYTGATQISAGILKFQDGTALTTTSNINVAGNATLQLDGSLAGTLNKPLSISGGGASGATGAFENVSGNNTYAGLITLTGSATINVDAGSLALTNTGTITGGGATLTLGGATGTTGTLASNLGMTTGGLKKTGGGTWTVSGTGTYTGATTVTGGTLIAAVPGALGGGSAASVSSGATLNLGGFDTQFSSLAGNSATQGGTVALGGATLTISGSSSATFAGVISGTGNLVLGGTANQTLAGANTFGGSGNSITLGSGTTLNINSASALGNAANTLVINSGATIDNTSNGVLTIGANPETWNGSFTYGGTHSITTAGNITMTAPVTITNNGAGGPIYNGNVSGAFAFTKDGTGQVSFGGTNAFTSVNILNGTLTGTSAGAFGTGTINLGDTTGSANATLNLGAATFANPLVVTAGNTGTSTLTGGSGAAVLAGAVAVNHDLAVTPTGSLTLSGALSGNGNITLNTTTGSLVLSGNNSSYTGAITVTAGNLVAGSANSIGSGAVTLSGGANGGTLSSTAAGTIGGSVTVGDVGVFIAPGGVNSIGSLTIGGSLTNTAAPTLLFDEITPTQGDLLTVGGTISGATPTVAFGIAPEAAGFYRLIANSGASSLASSLVLPAAPNNGGKTITYSWDTTHDPGYLDLNVAVSGTAVSGTWTQTATGAQSWTNAANWNNGQVPGIAGDSALFNSSMTAGQTVQLNGQQQLGSLTFSPAGAGAYTIAQATSGDLLVLNNGSTAATVSNTAGNNSISAPVALASNTTITVSGGSLGISGAISGQGNLTKAGANALTLSSPNTYTGTTTVTAGPLVISSSNALASTSAISVSAGGTLELANNITVPATTAAVSVAGSGYNSIGALSNLSGNNTWAANVTIAAGTLNGLSGSTTRIGTNGGTLTISGVISGPYDLLIRNAGTMILSGANNYTGATEIASGTTQLGANNSLPTGTNLNMGLTSVSGTFDLNGFNQTVAGFQITTGADAPNAASGYNNVVTNSSATPSTLTFTNSTNQVYNSEGSITGNLALVKLGASSFTLGGGANGAGAYTYTGSTTIGNGTFVLGVANALPSTTNVFFGTSSGTSGVLDLKGFAQTVAGLSDVAGSGTANQVINSVTATPAALTVNVPAAARTTFSGSLGGTGTGNNFSLTTAGAGTLVLGGANTYTGATNVSSGALQIDGNLAGTGAVTVASGATLQGRGSIAGPVALNGTITAGTGTSTTSTPGQLTTTGQQTWNNGATYGWKLNLNNVTAGATSTLNGSPLYTDTTGANWDQLTMSSLTVSASSTSQFTVNVIGVNGTAGGANSAFNPGQTYQWIAATVPTSLLAGNYVGAFNLNVSNVPAATGSFSAQFLADPSNTSQQDLIVSYAPSPAPEPTSLALLTLGAGGLLLRRRRRAR